MSPGKRSRCTFALLDTRPCVGEVFVDEFNCDAQCQIFEEMRAIRYAQGHAVALKCTQKGSLFIGALLLAQKNCK